VKGTSRRGQRGGGGGSEGIGDEGIVVLLKWGKGIVEGVG